MRTWGRPPEAGPIKLKSYPHLVAIIIMNQIATFGAGCFWCSEAVFQRLKGVTNVAPGYSGGDVPDPSYAAVCSGTTAHAEVAQIEFDPDQISYKDLVRVFFVTHNPTTKDRQGYDVGSEYRTVIFYHNDEQKKIAEDVKKELEEKKIYESPIVTEIEPFTNFYPAEKYHQNFYNNNPNSSYCHVVIDPKLAKLRAAFAPLLKQ